MKNGIKCTHFGEKYEENNVYRKEGVNFIVIEADSSENEYSPVYFKVCLITGEVEFLGNRDFNEIEALFNDDVVKKSPTLHDIYDLLDEVYSQLTDRKGFIK